LWPQERQSQSQDPVRASYAPLPVNGLQQDQTSAVEPGQHGVVFVGDIDHLDTISGKRDINPREALMLLETDGHGAIGVENNPFNPTP
jgi:hypothetical protein